MKDIFAKCDEPQIQDELKARDLFPYFHPLETRQDVEVIMEGKRRIMLGSNNYLGLTTEPEVKEAGLKALEQYGTGCSGSRLLNGTLKIHLELEGEISRFLRQEDAITFSTGFQSNLGIIAAISSRHDYVLLDKEDHASIYDAARLGYGKMLRYNHSDMADLEELLKTIPENCGAIIITDGVFSMGGDICKLPEIVELAKKYGAGVMVDDAHGLGVLGEGGRGTPSHFGLEKEVDIYMGTFSKSLASLGGYMAGSHRIVDYVRHASRPFIFSASVPPAQAAIALAALRYIEAHPERVKYLSEISDYFRECLKSRGVKIIEATTPIVPIYTYQMMNTLVKHRHIYEGGVYTNPVLPPACAPGECLLRTSLMATHTKPLLEEAADIIAKVMAEPMLED